MPALQQWFEKGMTSQAYIESMKVHKENLKKVYDGFSLPSDKEFFQGLKEKGLRVIVLTEDWCGDAMVNIPILLKLAEETGIEARMVLRDSNLELMDQYLTNGTARSIPIFIFIDREGNEAAVWGPRARKVQQLVDELRADLPSKEDASFEEKQKEVFGRMIKIYTEDEQIWNEVYSSLKETLKNA
jgi:glycerophosphoryl diester phosphodiesterase